MSARIIAVAALTALTLGTAAQAHSPTEVRARCTAEVGGASGNGGVFSGLLSGAKGRAIQECVDRHFSRPAHTHTLARSARSCPTNAPVLYRGNLYCFRGR